MAYDQDHYYLTIGGTAPEGEAWQFGTRWRSVTRPAISWFDGFSSISLEDIATAFSDAIDTMTSLWPTDIAFTYVKLAAIDQSGDYAQDPRTFVLGTPKVGTDAVRLPLQNAVVVSLWSGSQFGRANHGKVYLPALNFQRDANSGRANASRASTVQTAMRTFLLAAQGEINTVGYNYRLVINSRVGAGTHKDVAQIGVGRVADTQRRRRGALNDAKTYVAY